LSKSTVAFNRSGVIPCTVALHKTVYSLDLGEGIEWQLGVQLVEELPL
jgi:hypothetical protein